MVEPSAATLSLVEQLIAFDTTSRDSNLALIGFVRDHLAALHAAHDLDAAARHSVETCLGCTADADCARWLDAMGGRPGEPAFCPNGSLIATLQADRRLRSGGA